MKAFSMLELIFVLMILGILAAIALPKLDFSTQQSKILALKAEFALIQSALSAHRNDIFLNKNTNLKALDNAQIGAEAQDLFYCAKICASANCCAKSLLESPIHSSLKGWMKTGANTYSFNLGKERLEFQFRPDTQSFECTQNCKYLR